MKTFASDLSKKEYPIQERVSGKAIRQSVLDYIIKENPDFTEDKYLSVSELNLYRERYISDLLTNELGELSDLEKKVLKSLSNQTTLSDKLDGEQMPELSFGQRIADKVASFGGSWTFILSFLGFLFFWIAVNVFWLANRAFDPFPFILLNLILSCVAALQAPVIMMSQNRQEAKDRLRARNDYQVNLKAELEIRQLHEKIDHLLSHQWERMIEIQEVQLDLLNELRRPR